MGKFIEENALEYSDVFIAPQYSEITTRKSVDTSMKLLSLNLDVPIISANMDTVSESDTCISMYKAGAIGAMHRFLSIEQNIIEYKKVKNDECECFVSLGVNEESKERAKKLYDSGARYFVIDIAHGNSLIMKNMIFWLREEFGKEITIMAGNVSDSSGVENLREWGADIVKTGIGPGCFAAGTRILMSNGTYKNIEEIKTGERIINKNGKPANVKNSFTTGEREVYSYKTNIGLDYTFCTPEHKHWIGDISTNKTINFTGYKAVLDIKTKSNTSKYKWKSIEECNSKNSVCLVPKNIDFELEKTFEIDLKKRIGGNFISGLKYETYVTLVPNYELGYIFGTFLGDGHAHCTAQKNNSHIGSTIWHFGKNEIEIANKLNKCIQKIFGREASSIKEKNNTIQVNFCDKPFSDFLFLFDKRINKHLPNNLFVDDKKYLLGIFDGLIDSDGHIGKDNRIQFANTSKRLLELFSIITFILKGHFPNIDNKTKSIGKLKGAKIENIQQSYSSRLLINPSNRMTKEFQVVKILNKNVLNKTTKVYDLEIDDETNSFIANNVIVHNSVCHTKNITGVTRPQFSAVLDCCEYGNRVGIPIVADGGLKELGDACKAIAAGAALVMAGGLFAGCKETPGEILTYSEEGTPLTKSYRGMASKAAMRTIKREEDMATPEGTLISVNCRNESVVDVVKAFKGALQSSMSYSNSKNISEFQEKIIFGIKKQRH